MPLPTTQVGYKMLLSPLQNEDKCETVTISHGAAPQIMSRIYDATGKFAFDLFDINVMMSRFCLTRIFVDPKVWENTCSVSSL